MKVLVEFFDSCQLNNVIAGISCMPEKIVYIGNSDTMTKARQESLQRFFRLRKQKVTLEYIMIHSEAYQDICGTIQRILDKETDVCLDVTGGLDLFLLAVGELSDAYGVPIIRFDVLTGKMMRIKNAGHLPEPALATLTVRQSIVLNGGDIINPQNYLSTEQLTPTFSKEVRSLFQISKQQPKKWNQFVVGLEGLLNTAAFSADFRVHVDLSPTTEAHFVKIHAEYFMMELAKAGLILNYYHDETTLRFQYKNERIHRLMSKSGNILEAYSYLLVHELRKQKPSVFSDQRMGVPVDWDGVTEPRYHSGTKNEVDLILTKQAIPVFISCKYGEALKEALYELHTVAEHYGGKYAQKVLITAELSRNLSKKNSFLERARDMNIEVIYQVNRMSEDEFRARLLAIGTVSKQTQKKHRNF